MTIKEQSFWRRFPVSSEREVMNVKLVDQVTVDEWSGHAIKNEYTIDGPTDTATIRVLRRSSRDGLFHEFTRPEFLEGEAINGSEGQGLEVVNGNWRRIFKYYPENE